MYIYMYVCVYVCIYMSVIQAEKQCLFLMPSLTNC